MQLRHVLVLTRDVSKSLNFWGPHGLGLEVMQPLWRSLRVTELSVGLGQYHGDG
jgi:hypothetical protein